MLCRFLSKLFILSILVFSASATTKNQNIEAEPIGKFTVQIAAFTDEYRAKQYVQEIKTVGLNAFYFSVRLNKKNWFRVGTGLFATEKQAQIYRSEILKKNRLPEAIVRAMD